MSDDQDGSVIGPALIMILLSVLLFWLPGLGTLIAGIVGGKMAGGVGSALLASLLPSLILGVALFLMATLLTGIPVIGILAGMGGLLLALTQVGTLMLGALIGGLIA